MRARTWREGTSGGASGEGKERIYTDGWMSRGSGNSPIYFLRNAPGDFIFDQSKAPDRRWRARGAAGKRARDDRRVVRASPAAVSLDFLIRTKLDVHMHTFPSVVVVAVASAFELFAFFFSLLYLCLFFLLSTSDKPLDPDRLLTATRASRLLYISVPSFIFSGPDYTVKDRYSGGKTYRKILFNEKKNTGRKRNIFFNFLSRANIVSLVPPVEKVHAQ